MYRTLFIYIINFQTPESQLGSSKSSLNTTIFFQLVDVTSLYLNMIDHCMTSLILTCSEVWRGTAFCTVLSYMWISCSEVFLCKDFCKKQNFIEKVNLHIKFVLIHNSVMSAFPELEGVPGNFFSLLFFLWLQCVNSPGCQGVGHNSPPKKGSTDN